MRAVLAVATLLCLAACAARSSGLTARPATDLRGRSFAHIAVAPAMRAVAPGGVTRCRACGEVLSTEPLARNALDILTRQVEEAAEQGAAWRVASPAAVEEAMIVLGTRGLPEDAPGRARALGEALGVDGVLFAVLSRFRPRGGAEFAVQTPAAVSLSLHLLDVRSGTVVWHAHYDEEQQALSENLWNLWGFLRRGPRWVEARELSADGVREAVRALEGSLGRADARQRSAEE